MTYVPLFCSVPKGVRAGQAGTEGREVGSAVRPEKKKLGTTLSWPNIGLEQSSVYGFLGNNVSEGPSRWLCLCFSLPQVKYNGTEKEKPHSGGPQRSITVKNMQNMQNMQNNSCTSQVETPLTVADEFRVSASLGTPGIRRNPHHVVGRVRQKAV
ncbi:hypothetical protein C8R43DRAFT_957333 [Mycena crocata]|nr:hypothetical protein C8R43DRAFT_957333 [Mycena crocata]